MVAVDQGLCLAVCFLGFIRVFLGDVLLGVGESFGEEYLFFCVKKVLIFNCESLFISATKVNNIFAL